MYTTEDVIRKAYQNWIDENVPDGEDMGNCTLWTRVMQAAFPELTRVEGQVWGRMFMEGKARPHYHEYLMTSEGEIVDPTSKQFDCMFGPGMWSYTEPEFLEEDPDELVILVCEEVDKWKL